MSGVLVARPRRSPRGPACRICSLPSDALQEVNAAVWDGRQRRSNYRAAGVSAYAAVTGGEAVDLKTVTRHAEHIEASWREATPDDPATGREEPVFASDYESLTERAAIVGAQAMSALEQKVLDDELGDRELLGVAKLGLGARQREKELAASNARPEIALTAIFAIASGHADIPEAEVIEIVDTKALKATIQEERAELEARAAEGEA